MEAERWEVYLEKVWCFFHLFSQQSLSRITTPLVHAENHHTIHSGVCPVCNLFCFTQFYPILICKYLWSFNNIWEGPEHIIKSLLPRAPQVTGVDTELNVMVWRPFLIFFLLPMKIMRWLLEVSYLILEDMQEDTQRNLYSYLFCFL